MQIELVVPHGNEFKTVKRYDAACVPAVRDIIRLFPQDITFTVYNVCHVAYEEPTDKKPFVLVYGLPKDQAARDYVERLLKEGA